LERKSSLRRDVMSRLADPLVSFLVLLVIGIVIGLAAQRALPASWFSKFSKHLVDRKSVAISHALVGIAGSFVGFHLTGLLNLGGRGSIAPFVGAVVGAAAFLWGWKTIRI
jgi:uncharacterized membrane protein YeaQ/YmgE (transglycosylase-associated protein family)